MVSDCRFDRNDAATGGAIYITGNNDDLVEIESGTFDTNFASESGGGIFTTSSGGSEISATTFTNNAATSDGGGVP